MTLSHITVGRPIPQVTRERGAELYRQHKVRIAVGSAYACLGTVKGLDGLFDVNCRIEIQTPRSILVRCTCSTAKAEFIPCKHIWAMILAAYDLGHLTGLSGSDPQTLDYDKPKPTFEIKPPSDYDDEGEFDDDDDDEYARSHPMRSGPNKYGKHSYSPPPKALPPQAPEPAWRKLMQTIPETKTGYQYTSRSEQPWPAGREVIYIFDSARMRGANMPVEVMSRERKMNGEWSKPKNGAPSKDQIPTLIDRDDREILTALMGASQEYYSGYRVPTSFAMSAQQCEFLVPHMARTGRLLRKMPDPNAEYLPLQWDEAGPWKFRLAVEKPDEKEYRIVGQFLRGEEIFPIESADFIFPSGILIRGDSIAAIDTGGAFSWILLLYREGALKVPANQFDLFLQASFGKSETPPLKLPEDLQIIEIDPVPQPLLQVRPNKLGLNAKEDIEGSLKFRYGDRTVPYDPDARASYSAEKRTLMRRDRNFEVAARQRLDLARVKQDRHERDPGRVVFSAKQLPDLVKSLMAEGWQVEAEGKLYRSAGKFQLDVNSGIDWFEVRGKVDFDGTEVSLPKILAAIRNRETMIDLGGGAMGLIPEEWLRKFSLLAGVGTKDGNHVRFEKNQVGLLDAMLAAQPEATFDETFRTAREQFARFEGIEAVEPPPQFHGELREYQKEGLGWLRFLRQFRFGGCLADDMGLGKTVQVLAMLVDRALTREPNEPKTSLIVMPKSLVFNWRKEAERFAPHLTVLDHTGTERSKEAEHILKHDLVLTTYGTLRNDMPYLKDIDFDYCILDESQAIKNSSTESSKAVRLLRGRHRLAMSGTPIENHLGELWSLFDFLNPGMLGHGSALKVLMSQGKDEQDDRTVLSKALKPFLLRRTKEQVAKDLPQKTEQTIYCDLDAEQRKDYDELKEYYRQSLLGRIETDGMNKSKILILEALLRLRQAACHPGLIDKNKVDQSSAKLDALIPQLHEVFEEGHKAIVFSQFTSLLAILKKRLNDEGIPYEYLDGKTRDRQAKVETFQNDPECKLFLISLKAGGVGLNLTAAEYVFLLDPWWNPAVEAQAIDRTHRIGQTKPVFAYRLIARNTVEEKVLELQNKKKDLADAILNADSSLIRTLKREDLEMLLS